MSTTQKRPAISFKVEGGTLVKYRGFDDKVVIPNGVTSIGESAFNGCSSLVSVTIPDDVTSIGESAFWGYSSLIGIVIPDDVTSIDRLAFIGCSAITIYCRMPSQPSGWSSEWNLGNCTVVWSYMGE